MIWLRAMPYVAAAGVAAGLVWWVMSQQATIAAQQAEISALRGELATCAARALNRNEDQDSDNDVDQRTGGGDWTVPDNWLRGDSDAAGD